MIIWFSGVQFGLILSFSIGIVVLYADLMMNFMIFKQFGWWDCSEFIEFKSLWGNL